MAFHTACPITCRRICDCDLGCPPPGDRFVEEIARAELFFRDPWWVKPPATVQVRVPRVEPPPEVTPEDAEEAASVRRAAAQQAAAATTAAEDYVRKLEALGAAEAQGEEAGDGNVFSAEKVMCRICFSGESEGSEKAARMLSCKYCSKKYHKSCVKNWAENRDLFNWNSWACPSCRVCEVCRRAGDPNRLMYCKRCDAAYHCYCQQPPHKNVSHGPYLCPKHTRCHSCGSNVPGSGLSTRWFLGYTCCDACGRLFTKGNYCPVCLKVYRDSETTPMVCCDVCHKWVHCICDGISDEKYQQFQADQNLYYKCATCRGNCYKVKDLDDAVRELWKRKDEDDRDLIATLRVDAGLPPQEILSVPPYSDDEENTPYLKSESVRPLKFSINGGSDKSAKYAKEAKVLSPSKKNFKKKGYQIKFVHKSEEPYQNVERHHKARSLESSFGGNKITDVEPYIADGPEKFPPSLIRSSYKDEAYPFVRQKGSKNANFVREEVVNNADRVSTGQNKGDKLQGIRIRESAGKIERKSESAKGTKLVIHLKNTNASSSPRSETSSCHREQDISASGGSQSKRENDVLEAHVGSSKQDDGRGDRYVDAKQQNRNSKHAHRDKNIVKLGKIYDTPRKKNGNLLDEYELPSICETPPAKRKRSMDSDPTVGSAAEGPLRNDKHVLKKQLTETSESKSIPNTPNDLKPLLKLKFKNPYFDQKSSWAPRGEEENSVKGQRSKRKRPSAEKIGFPERVGYGQLHQEVQGDEAMEAKILLKLGKGAVGKRIEVHQSSDNSWRPGVVSGTIEGSSSLTVRLDDGGTTTLELGKHGVRFVEKKKQKKAPYMNQLVHVYPMIARVPKGNNTNFWVEILLMAAAVRICQSAGSCTVSSQIDTRRPSK